MQPLVAVLLIASMQAQASGLDSATESSMTKASVSQPKLVAGFGFEYDKLRRDTEEFAEVTLYSSERLALGSAGGKDPRLVPTRLEFEPREGFKISPILYPRAHGKRFFFDKKPFTVLEQGPGRYLGFRFKVRAKPDLPLGSYKLNAKLRFQVVTESGVSGLQELPIEIPIEVVDHKTKVESVDRGIGGIRGLKPGEWAGMVVLAPVWIPLWVFMTMIGWDGC